MPRQLTIRNVPDEVGKRLDRLSRARGRSLNSLVVDILTESVGVDARRARLERYATWTEEEAAAFDEALASQRVVDAELWR
jgi:plasmid stability protein